MEYLKRTWAEINLDALVHNFNLIKNASKSPVAAVVKADAYGHGAIEIASVLEKEGAAMFAVSNIDEALELRKAGIKVPVLILGYTPVHYTKALADNNFIQAVYSLQYASQLSKRAVICGVNINCHLKIDTGMSRLGFNCRNSDMAELDDIISAANLSGITVSGAFTHFATADFDNDENGIFTQQQYDLFCSVCERIESAGIKLQTKHCCNSAGILCHKDKRMDLSRPGIVLYGLTPSAELNLPLELKPVMTLKSIVSFIKKISKGDTVSYGRNFTAEKDMTVATIPAGYADGYPRACGNKASVLIRGKRAPILGNVCMDQMIVDVSDIEGVAQDDVVTLFGSELPVEEIAKICNTINYEIVCGIARRVPRIYTKNDSEVKVVDYILD